MSTQIFLFALISLVTIAIQPILATETYQCQAIVKARYVSFLKNPIGEDPWMSKEMMLTASIVDTEGEELCSIQDAIKDPKSVVEVPCTKSGVSIFLDGPTTRDDLQTMGLQFTKTGKAYMLKREEGVGDFHDDLVYKTVESFPCNSLHSTDDKDI